MTPFPFESHLATKLFPSTGAGASIARPRLAAPAGLLAGAPLVVTVVGPAGYGKSTLMAHWAALMRRHAMPCAWFTLDEDDNDPARLIGGLSASLLQREDGHAAPAPVAASRLKLEHLGNQLAAIDKPLVLFLDDLHALRNPEALRVTEWMVHHAPPTVRFVIASRGAPRLRLNALRMRGHLHTINVEQLRFDADEGRRFLHARLDATLAESIVEKLVACTEGWPAALQLATLTMGDKRQQAEIIKAFKGTPRDLVDYLSEVLADQFDDDTRSFIFIAAHFQRMSGELLAAASGLADARERLLALHRRGVFLVALDADDEWFRFHHLVSNHFRSHLRPANRAGATAAVLQGARWLHAQGSIAQAIDVAILAKAWAQACAWLSDCIERMSLLGSENLAVSRWLQAIPESWVDRHPHVLAYSVLALTSGHHGEESDRQLARLEVCLSQLEQTPGGQPQEADALRRTVQAHRAIRRCTQEHGPEALKPAVQWLARWPDAPLAQRGLVQTALGYGTLYLAKPYEAKQHAQSALDALTRANDLVGLAWHRRLDVLLEVAVGDYHRAQERCASGIELLLEQLDATQGEVALFRTVQAVVAYEFNDLRAARAQLVAGELNTHGIALTSSTIIQPTIQARLLFHDGNAKGAFAALHAGQAQARRLQLRPAELALVGEECIWLCRLGRHADAARVAALYPSLGWRPHMDAMGIAIWAALQPVSARIRMHEAPAEVAAMVARALPDIRAMRMQLGLVKLLILHAAAMDLGTQREDILRTLTEAARIGSTQGYRRVFIDDTALLQPLLDALRSPALDWIETALRDAAPAPKPGPGSHEALTPRELVILKKLDGGLNNRGIAQALFISEGTLKWHLNNIYGKLQVRHRSGACARARALGLI